MEYSNIFWRSFQKSLTSLTSSFDYFPAKKATTILEKLLKYTFFPAVRARLSLGTFLELRFRGF
jgi:hypothetical protein